MTNIKEHITTNTPVLVIIQGPNESPALYNAGQIPVNITSVSVLAPGMKSMTLPIAERTLPPGSAMLVDRGVLAGDEIIVEVERTRYLLTGTYIADTMVAMAVTEYIKGGE